MLHRFKQNKTRKKRIFLPILLIGSIALFLRLFRLSYAPAIHGDEMAYFNLAQSLLIHGELLNEGNPWFIHPPIHFLALASFFKFTGIHELSFDTLLMARAVSATFSAFVSIILFIFGLKLLNLKSAIVISALYCVEPFLMLYGGRIGFIEPVAIFFSTLALLFYYNYRQTNRERDCILTGIFIGLSLVTKEVTIFIFFIILICIIFDRYILKYPSNFRQIAVIFSIALFIYLLYVLWGFTISYQAFITYKTRSIFRVLGLLQRAEYLSPTKPLNVLLEDMVYTLNQYWVTYLLIASSIPAAIYLFIKRRKTDVFILSWYIGIISFYIFVFHLYSPQFFDYLLIPIIVINGYILSHFLTDLKIHFSSHKVRVNIRSNFVPLCTLTFLLVSTLSNINAWYGNYGIGDDRAFQHTISYIESNIGNDAGIYTHRTLAHFISDNYRVRTWHESDNISRIIWFRESRNFTYYIVSPRWSMARSEIMDYIKAEGVLVASIESRTLRSIDIYYLPFTS